MLSNELYVSVVHTNVSIGDSNSYGRKGILSAPIFMDNVACYGSEDKLVDCSYHTDTNEDNHINDIWIKCNVTVSVFTSANVNDNSNNNTSSTIALAMSMIALGISVLVLVVLLIGYLVYRHKSNTHNIMGSSR